MCVVVVHFSYPRMRWGSSQSEDADGQNMVCAGEKAARGRRVRLFYIVYYIIILDCFLFSVFFSFFFDESFFFVIY